MNKIITSAIIAMVSVSLATAAKFKPSPSPNPWADNYEELDSVFANPSQWGTYNVHDPSMCKVGDYYFMYSTDAVHMPRHKIKREDMPKMGFLQIRKSKDLVHWQFCGWAFDSIPEEGADWVRAVNNGRGPGNIWAPYMVPAPDGSSYRLYYCVSSFGKKTSAICLAEAPSPEGPWTHKGCVVRTHDTTPMNAIDPTIITDANGKWWMHYGSYFGGLYCVQLDPSTGYTVTPHDKGHLVARRANYKADNLEAPEILYNPALDQYYLFGSYGPLQTTYNVRVCRGDNPEGPFIDFHGKEMADTTDNFPILTAPYRFENHPGWMGTAHCGVVSDGQGHYFMAHQGRLAPRGMMMDLHLRRIFFTPSGWPVVSPERYAATPERKFDKADLSGEWEIVRVREPKAVDTPQPGHDRRGRDMLRDGEWALSATYNIKGNRSTDGRITNIAFDEAAQLLSMTIDGEDISDVIVTAGHDWEREQDTILFTGLDSDGRTIWGKRVK